MGTSAGEDRAPIPGLRLVVAPRATLRILLPVVAGLSAASFLGQVLVLGLGLHSRALTVFVHLTYVDREPSIPTWFQSMVLLACAAALWTVADEVRARGERWHRQWRLLAVTFGFLSLDEIAMLHERAVGPVRAVLGQRGVLYFGWFVVAAPLVLVLVAVLVPFLRALPRWTLRAFIVSGALYLGGSVGLEMVGAVLAQSSGQDSMPFATATAIEELLEMLGMTLFLASIAAHRLRARVL